MTEDPATPRDDPEPSRPELAPGAFFRTASIFYFVLAVAAVLWLGLARGAILPSLFVVPDQLALDLVWGVAAGALLLLLWQGGRALFPGARELERQLAGLLRGLTPSEAIVLALLSGFAEELFFRGAVQGSVGWLWASLAFALLHTGPGRVFRLWTFFALAAGLIFAALVELRGTLLPAILAHVLVNGVNLYRMTLEENDANAAVDPSGNG